VNKPDRLEIEIRARIESMSMLKLLREWLEDYDDYGINIGPIVMKTRAIIARIYKEG